jgi:hypothetical protein
MKPNLSDSKPINAFLDDLASDTPDVQRLLRLALAKPSPNSFV